MEVIDQVEPKKYPADFKVEVSNKFKNSKDLEGVTRMKSRNISES